MLGDEQEEYEQQLQTAKEENEKLKTICKKSLFCIKKISLKLKAEKTLYCIKEQINKTDIDTLTQQNKEMRGLLKKHCKRCDSSTIGCCNRDNCYIYHALKGVE